MEKRIENLVLDEERALYHLCGAEVSNCRFEGPADGESALKEARDINVKDCFFGLRYPLWHVKGFRTENCDFPVTARAGLWYAENGTLENCRWQGPKAVRECRDILLKDCELDSVEFGWKCRGLCLENCSLNAEYPFFDSREVTLKNVRLKGKYSFQYMEELHISDSFLDTKDAFWHSKNVTVENSTVIGEYLGWFSEGLTLRNCLIRGTQPLCYCKGLVLENCRMEDCDLAFEYSEVEAEVQGHIDSVKNPLSGHITADSVGEIIMGDAITDCRGTVELR